MLLFCIHYQIFDHSGVGLFVFGAMVDSICSSQDLGIKLLAGDVQIGENLLQFVHA